jgi:hypothetical protein
MKSCISLVVAFLNGRDVLWTWRRERCRDILRAMKTIHVMLLLGCCVLVFSCTNNTRVEPPSAPAAAASPTAPPPAHENVAGGLSTPEPGETESSEFQGTAGTTEKKRASMQPALLKAVRTGKHAQFDRVVFEFEGKAVPGYLIEYVDKPVRDCGQGAVVPISGDGFLMIRLQPANAHTEAGQPSVENRQQNPNFNVLKELKLICDFEADVQWILGLTSPNRYRVMELTNPARLVVDIAHRKGSA